MVMTNQDNAIIKANSFPEDDEFFDCLDEVEFDLESQTHTTATAITSPRPPKNYQNYENQIAVYSGRKVTYPDGTLACVHAGETMSKIPGGYTIMHTTRAASKYVATQQWRQKEKIYNIHTRPHSWFTTIKDAYAHIIHGFTKDGMLVVYERPGTMKMKEMLRSGCSVDDLVFHYCYLMEFMSNMESILTELHSNDDGEEARDNSWQDELAAFAHAKQRRIQKDPMAYSYIVVMDITGASPSFLSADVLAYSKRSADINTAHYPGSMRRLIAVNTPFWIGVIWKRMKSILPASVTTDVLSSAQMEEGGLTKYIDEDQIPAEYGGKSKFKLGEHPFEVGLKELVRRQGECSSSGADEPVSAVASPLHESTPSFFPPSSAVLERNVEDVNYPQDNMTPSSKHVSTTCEWDGLGSQGVLTIAAILQFFVFFVIGSLELALPYWIISPPDYGGLGCEARRNGMAILVSCLIIFLAIKRSRFSQLTRSTIERSPLRGFRIGIGAMCFFLVCLGLIPLTLEPNRSTLGLFCFSAYLSFIFFGVTLGILALEHVRNVVLYSTEEESETFLQSSKSTLTVSMFGRVAGYIFVAPIFRWSIRKDLFFPLNASFFLCLLAFICWMVYIVSFSLHTEAPPPTMNRTKKKETMFMSAMVGLLSFIRQVFWVAFADINFLAYGK